MDVISLDSLDHVLHHQPAADEDTTDCADVVESLEERGLVLIHAADEADDGDDTVNSDSLERLRHCGRATDLDNVLHTDTAGELLGLLAPVGCLLVVDDLVSTVALEGLGLRGRGCGRNDARTSSLGELKGEDGDTAGTLCKDPLTGLQRPALQAVQRIPCRQSSAGQCASLEVIQILGRSDETLLVEDTVLAQCTVNSAAEAGREGGSVEGASNVGLVEEGYDTVALLESCDAATDGLDDTSAIRAGNNTVLRGEGVLALGNDEVAVVEGCSVDWIVLAVVYPVFLERNVPLTRTSLSPILGIEALSLNFRASKPVLPSIVHCLVVEGAIMCILRCYGYLWPV